MRERHSAAFESTPTNVIPFAVDVPSPAPVPAPAEMAALEVLPDVAGATYPRTGDSPLWTITFGLVAAGMLFVVGIFWARAGLSNSTVQHNKSRMDQIAANYAVRGEQLDSAKAANIDLQRQLDETKAEISRLHNTLAVTQAETVRAMAVSEIAR